MSVRFLSTVRSLRLAGRSHVSGSRLNDTATISADYRRAPEQRASPAAPRCSERDDLPHGAAVGEAVEAFVELIERDVLAQQAVDRQAPCPIQLDVARD